MGIHTMLTGIRGVIAPFVGAYLIGAAGIGNTFLVGFVMMLISTIMMIRFAKNKTQHDLQNNITREFVPKALAE